MHKIKRLNLGVLFIIYLVSCHSNEEVTPSKSKPKWIKTEFENQGAIHSIYGSIEKDLIVGTIRALLRTTDQGKNWIEVLKVNYPIKTIFANEDKLYAISHFENYYSIDNGETWTLIDNERTPVAPFSLENKKNSSDGKMYYHEAISNGELITPSLILMSSDNGTNWENIFPYKRYIYSMYLDDNDRLYLGTRGANWDETKGSFVADEPRHRAILYYQEIAGD